MGRALFWKLLERFSVQVSQFIIQIVLARLLSPEHYGAIALMMIFVTIANVIIQNGFSTALIRDKEADEDDFSSVFWLCLFISFILYTALYLSTPYVVSLYNMPYLEKPFKSICLILIPGAINSVQLAIIRKRMDFKKEFTSNLISIIVAGLVGICLAYFGFGLWALVVQVLLNTTISTITMWNVVGWRPRFVLKRDKIQKLFSFGYKLVLAGLLDTFSQDLSSFIIGAKYSSSALGFFTRGKQFPSAMMGALNSAVQSVMLPALSQLQDDREKAKQLMRKAMMLSAFCIFPLMALLAGIAKPMVSVVLTDKWLDCVPYIQIFCFSYAFWPVHTSNLQAINAMGRSDIFLRLEVYKKVLGWSTLAFAVFYFDDPIAIAATSILMTIISCFINCYPNKYLLNYSYIEQMKDILPYFTLSIFIFGIMQTFNCLSICNYYKLLIQIVIGSMLYISISHFLKLQAYLKIKKKLCFVFGGRIK